MTNKLPSVDQLIELAKNNPDELERLRQQHVTQLIESAPEPMQRRLKGLQFQIDSKKKLHSSPMGSCIMLSKMMLDSLSQLNSALHGNDSKQHPSATNTAARKADVIPFPEAVNQ